MTKKYDSVEAIRRWDIHAREWAGWCTADGGAHRIVLLNPALFELLGDVSGKRMLDAGCGEGYLSRKLAEFGAYVTGVDFAREMLNTAHERTDAAFGIRYLHGNCEDLSFLESESFDIVVSNMVLQDLSDLGAALKSMHRVLVKKGILVFSILHPCFSAGQSGWVKSDQGEKLYWKTDRYFYEEVYEQPWPPDTPEGLLLFHRTLSSYLRTLLETGFDLLDVIEPKPSEEMLRHYPEFRDDMRMSHFSFQSGKIKAQ